MNNQIFSLLRRASWLWLFITLLLIGLVTFFAPLDQTLGGNSRLVYFHGAWVWAGKAAFGAAGLVGLIGLLWRKETWQRYSLALGRTGLFFWLTYLPLSLYIQQVNWGGIFWDEPRWKIPLAFGIAGILLQIGLAFMADLRLASLANLGFGAALWYMLARTENVLHPASPIFGTDAVHIQIFFSLILVFSLTFGAILGRMFYRSTGKL